VVGYLRPVANYNSGKKEEYMERKKFVLEKDTEIAREQEELPVSAAGS
jgi:ribonucleoside-triphosphate reductase